MIFSVCRDDENKFCRNVDREVLKIGPKSVNVRTSQNISSSQNNQQTLLNWVVGLPSGLMAYSAIVLSVFRCLGRYVTDTPNPYHRANNGFRFEPLSLTEQARTNTSTVATRKHQSVLTFSYLRHMFTTALYLSFGAMPVWQLHTYSPAKLDFLEETIHIFNFFVMNSQQDYK